MPGCVIVTVITLVESAVIVKMSDTSALIAVGVNGGVKYLLLSSSSLTMIGFP